MRDARGYRTRQALKNIYTLLLVSIHEKYVKILQPSGSIENKFH